MLVTILEKIKERLDTVSGLTVLYDVKQSEKAKRPLAVINFESQSPNSKTRSRFQVSLSLTIELVHNTLFDLLNLIEAVETALQLSKELERYSRLGLSRLD